MTWASRTGDAYGNFAPLANLIRIQGAAFLIRAQALTPPDHWTAAKIELVTADKSENLIGKAHRSPSKSPTPTAIRPWACWSTSTPCGPTRTTWVTSRREAAVTDSLGEVTVNLISTEPGTQRLSARPSPVAGHHLHHQVLAGAG